MKDFIKELKPVTTRNPEKIVVTDKAEKNKDLWLLNNTGFTIYRGVCGSTQWATTQGRPDQMGNVSSLQAALSKPTLGDLKRAAKVVEKLLVYSFLCTSNSQMSVVDSVENIIPPHPTAVSIVHPPQPLMFLSYFRFLQTRAPCRPSLMLEEARVAAPCTL